MCESGANEIHYNLIHRLNSGNRNGHNFFMLSIFIFQKPENDLVIHADFGDIKTLVPFPGSAILKFLFQF